MTFADAWVRWFTVGSVQQRPVATSLLSLVRLSTGAVEQRTKVGPGDIAWPLGVVVLAICVDGSGHKIGAVNRSISVFVGTGAVSLAFFGCSVNPDATRVPLTPVRSSTGQVSCQLITDTIDHPNRSSATIHLLTPADPSLPCRPITPIPSPPAMKVIPAR